MNLNEVRKSPEIIQKKEEEMDTFSRIINHPVTAIVASLAVSWLVGIVTNSVINSFSSPSVSPEGVKPSETKQLDSSSGNSKKIKELMGRIHDSKLLEPSWHEKPEPWAPDDMNQDSMIPSWGQRPHREAGPAQGNHERSHESRTHRRGNR